MQMTAFLLSPPTPIPTSLLVSRPRQLPLTSRVRQRRQPNQTARGGKKVALKGQKLSDYLVTAVRFGLENEK